MPSATLLPAEVVRDNFEAGCCPNTTPPVLVGRARFWPVAAPPAAAGAGILPNVNGAGTGAAGAGEGDPNDAVGEPNTNEGAAALSLAPPPPAAPKELVLGALPPIPNPNAGVVFAVPVGTGKLALAMTGAPEVGVGGFSVRPKGLEADVAAGAGTGAAAGGCPNE